MSPTPAPAPSDADRDPNAVGRRRFLKGSALAGLFLLSPAAARAATRTGSKTAAKTATKTAAKSTTKVTKAATKSTNSTAVFDPADELAVNFTFATSDGGFRIHNPYVAVFIEDSAGSLVRTIDLSIETGRGLRYVHELQRWYRSANGGNDLVDTISSATRVPGAYHVVWDGRNESKALMPKGEYYVCIEAAREHGPYELIRESVTIAGAPFMKKFADSGELQGASVELRSRV